MLNANVLDPKQMSRFAASDLGLLCLTMPFLFEASHKFC